MSNLTQEQIDQIAKRVIGLIQNQPDNRALSQPYAGTASAASASLGNGIFPNIDSAVEAAGRAHLQLMKM